MVLHIFGCLKRKYNSRMVFDSTVTPIDEGAFKNCNWNKFYGDVTDAILTNAPRSCGTGVSLLMYDDSNHAGEKRTRHFIWVSLFLSIVHLSNGFQRSNLQLKLLYLEQSLWQ